MNGRLTAHVQRALIHRQGIFRETLILLKTVVLFLLA
jgi:hypothetical protein